MPGTVLNSRKANKTQAQSRRSEEVLIQWERQTTTQVLSSHFNHRGKRVRKEANLNTSSNTDPPDEGAEVMRGWVCVGSSASQAEPCWFDLWVLVLTSVACSLS